MKEVEIKVLEVDKLRLESILQKVHAQKTFEGELYARFFDDPEKSITQKGDVLRIRRAGTEIIMAYKKHISREGAKVMEEYEVILPDTDPMIHILACLGLTVIKETRKYRTEYVWDQIKFVFDEYLDNMRFIPPFLEIEAESMDEIEKGLKLLKIDKEIANSWSTYDLIQHYGR